MKHSTRNPRNGQFTRFPIVSGRLYKWQGIPVRAFGMVNGKRYVAAHKVLTGLVTDAELEKMTRDEVNAYLGK